MIEEFITDTLEMLDVPFSGVGGKAVTYLPKMLISKKMQEKRDLLVQELKSANLPIEKIADDEFVSAVWRIHMAIIQGAANANIKLLARVLTGLHETSEPVYADQFLRYAQILEPLSLEEIYILGMLSRELLDIYPIDDLNKGCTVETNKLHGIVSEVHRKYVEAGKDGYDFSGYCAALLRTGLLVPIPALGGVSYMLSPLFVKLVRIFQNNIDSVLS
jgi:hypothetical protein